MAKKMKWKPDPSTMALHRATVKTLAAYFVRYDEMAAIIGCDRDQLEELFADELSEGSAIGQVKLLREGHHMAMGRPAEFDKEGRTLRAEVQPSVPLLIFLIERKVPGFAPRARVKEPGEQKSSVIEITGYEVYRPGGK